MKNNLELKVSQIVSSSVDALPTWASDRARAAEGLRAAVWAETVCGDLRRAGGTKAGQDAFRAARKYMSLDMCLAIETATARKAMARKAMATSSSCSVSPNMFHVEQK